jgi:hypothetical protein
MNSLLLLSNDALLLAFNVAKELNLSNDFINLLEEELKNRSITMEQSNKESK